MTPWREDLLGWGRNLRARHRVARPTDRAAALRALAERPGGLLPRGCGRSYGDVALNPDGLLLDCRGLDRFVSFDRETGHLSCEAGVTLGDILEPLSHPRPDGARWFLPVTPGTRHVTVGGAIANDVHGKNHHVAGSFGHHLVDLDLARSDGTVLRCSPETEADLFRATVGGLGLTGLILRATIALRRVEGTALEAEDVRFDGLDDFFALSAEADGAWEYTAAWIDCRRAGRGVFSRARHAAGRDSAPPSPARLRVPVAPPVSAVNGLSVRAFNAIHWRRAPREPRPRVTDYAGVLYPLDGIADWNRLYGPRGFFQFQNVVPPDAARDALDEMLGAIARSGEGSMLSVLKLFGDHPPPGLLSFPRAGATLALDFADRGASTLRLLERLEAITVEAGGRIYPAKDSLMSADSFAAFYPAAPRFREFVDPAFTSAFARRVGLAA